MSFLITDLVLSFRLNIFKFRFDQFDNRLFGISEKEAERMDPQQKFVLECLFMALQDAGITKKSIQGSNTGVFIGM